MQNQQMPTIGRIVHYYLTEEQASALETLGNPFHRANEPMAAIITAIWGPEVVNPKVFVDGLSPDLFMTSVPLFRSPGDGVFGVHLAMAS